jgi:DHA3 family macrolide efflux protein-like MFS transporter
MFRDRNLSLLAAGQTLSRLGDVSFHIGLLWLTLELTGSKRLTGLVAMLEYLPVLLFGVIAGVLVDRLDRRRVMLAACLFRALLMLAIPLAALAGRGEIAVGAAAAFGLALAASLFTPARDALVPVLVGGGDRVRANALVQGSDQLAWLTGPLVAGVLLTLAGTVSVFLGSSLLFLLSFALLLGLRLPARLAPPVPALQDGGEAGAAPAGHVAWREAREGLALAWRLKELRWLLVLTAVNNFFIMGPAIVAMPVYVGSDLGLPGGYYAAIEAVLAGGMMISSLLIVRWRPRRGKGALWLAGMVLDGLTYGPMLLAPRFAWLVPLILLHALFIPLITIYRVSIVQDMVPPAMQGRAFAFLGMSVVGMTALSCGVTGLLLGVVPTPLLFGVWGLLGMGCGLAGWLSPRLRRLA